MFITNLFKDPRSFFLMVLFVVFSVTLHEFMHAWVALKMGDPTAADHGHLTLNPFRQMGLFSLVMLCFIGIAWGQVPVNPLNLNSRKKRILVALAGVSANLFLSITFTFLALLVLIFANHQKYAADMLLYGATINMVLLILNLMPFPGFDGFNIAAEFIRIRSQKSAEKANIIFFAAMMILFVFGINHIIDGASFLVSMIFYALAGIMGVL